MVRHVYNILKQKTKDMNKFAFIVILEPIALTNIIHIITYIKNEVGINKKVLKQEIMALQRENSYFGISM